VGERSHNETITPPSVEELIIATRETYAGPLELGEDLVSFHIGDEIAVRRWAGLQQADARKLMRATAEASDARQT
jgi:ribonuclease Z